MSRHILYIINPISGTRKKKDLQAGKKKTCRPLLKKKPPKETFPLMYFHRLPVAITHFCMLLSKKKK